ncbi:C-type lectin domain family 4 member G-like [Nematolebias whitei]|uniref:C-type lectin domain family 4 member G-like n=1 Tax=Nematolebias whitei TaxID=451745 RepID=UPI001897E978|nr:C-type lectin domain family 4 member G-like [Nematolebias whitei]
MEDEVSYSSLVFKNSGATQKEAETAANGQTPLMSVCLGILCVLLLIAVIVLSVIISMVKKDQEATISDLKAKNDQLSVANSNLTNQTKQLVVEKINLMNQTKQLMDDKLKLQNNNTALNSTILTLNNQISQLQNNTSVLKNQTEKLTKERNNLNWTLGFILTFDTFPVKVFCPNKTCQPCLVGWIQFQDKCYLFYNENSASAWKTWDQSRQFCQNNFSDLVVINNLQEQQFVGNLTKFYLDEWHGFWLGLRNVNNNWVWVDGRTDTLGFWGSTNIANESVLLVPGTPPTQSWRRLTSSSADKFICERDALVWSI